MTAEPDAPEELQNLWRPEDLALSAPVISRIPWISLGIAVMLASLAISSAIGVILHLADRSVFLGALFGLTFSLGVGLIIYGMAGEWRCYRKLKSVDRMRAVFADDTLPYEVLRASALGWLDQVSMTLPDAAVTIGTIRSASTAIEIRAALRNRAAEPLHQKAKEIGRRAGLQAASMIALSPHASWDGMIAGMRGLLIIREVAQLFGMRPGLGVTFVLVRKVARTAAGVAATDLVSQKVAEHTLSAVPVIKDIVAPATAAALVTMRLSRLASFTAEACCPVRK